MDKAIPYLFCLSVALAIPAPMFCRPPVDGFPLSTYPMFAQERSTSLVTVHHALAVYPDNRREVLPPRVASGNEAALQTQAVLVDAIVGGRTAELCRRIAARVSATRFAGAVAIEIASSTFDSIEFFTGQRAPRRRRVHARCWTGETS